MFLFICDISHVCKQQRCTLLFDFTVFIPGHANVNNSYIFSNPLKENKYTCLSVIGHFIYNHPVNVSKGYAILNSQMYLGGYKMKIKKTIPMRIFKCTSINTKVSFV